MRHRKKLVVVEHSRVAFRKAVVREFLKELPGSGKADLCSFYVYEVEKLPTGETIELRRPAVLNKGFDFTVHVPGFNFSEKRTSDLPTHKFVINDLKEKKLENLLEYKKLRHFVDEIYQCHEVEYSKLSKLQLKAGLQCELIIKIIKWLFVEQDVTYWNWSGRAMLYSAIQKLDDE